MTGRSTDETAELIYEEVKRKLYCNIIRIMLEDAYPELRAKGMMVPVKSCAGIYFDATPDYRQLRNECQDCRGIAESCSLCEIRQSR